MQAELQFHDPIQNVSAIKVNDHVMQMGGACNGFCYEHQTFDCVLSDTEIQLLHTVEYKDNE